MAHFKNLLKKQMKPIFSSDIFLKSRLAHKIGVIDIRIINCDRNDDNILVMKFKFNNNTRKKQKNSDKSYYKLIPIDHSLSLPDSIEILE